MQASDLAQLLRRAPVAAASAASPSATAEGAGDVRRLLLDVARLMLPADTPDGGTLHTGTSDSPDASGAAAAPHSAASSTDTDEQYVTAWLAAAASAAQPESTCCFASTTCRLGS